MDNTPKVVEDAPATHKVVERSSELEALVAEVERMAEAQDVANAAEPVVITDDAGNEVRSLNLKLSAVETMRVMAMPPAERAKMATHILKERRLAAEARREQERAKAAHTSARKKERRRKKRNARRSR